MGVSKRGNSYYVEFYHEKKRYRWSAGTNKKRAEELMLDIKLAIRDGSFETKFLHVKADEYPLAAGVDWYLTEYVPQNIPAEKNRRQIELTLRRFIEIVGDKPAIEVRIRDVEKFKLERLKTVTKVSVDRELGIVSGLFSRLAKFELIDFNPVSGKIVYFHEDSRRKRYATVEELKRIMDAIDDTELKLIVLVAVFTGMRLSDICNLSVEKIDFGRGVIEFRQGKTGVMNVVPMGSILSRLLKEYIERVAVKDRLFTIEASAVSNIWRGLIVGLNIKPHLQFRDLRRTFSTLLYNQSDVDIKLVSELLGHTKIDLSDKVYTITDIQKKRTAIEEMEKGLGFVE